MPTGGVTLENAATSSTWRGLRWAWAVSLVSKAVAAGDMNRILLASSLSPR